MGVLLRNPIHSMAGSAPSSFAADARVLPWFHRAVFSGVCIGTLAPAFFWALFVPAWPYVAGRDSALWWGICGSFLIFVLVMAAILAYVGSCVSISAAVYFFHKAVQTFLLFWRGEEVAHWFILDLLIGAQMAEMASAAVVVWRNMSNRDSAERLNDALYGSQGG